MEKNKLYDLFEEMLTDDEKNAIAERLIQKKDPEQIYIFAKYVKGSPIKKLAEAICETNSAQYIYLFARDIGGVPVEKFTEAFLKTDTKWVVHRYIEDIKGISIEQFVQAICQTDSAANIYWFATQYPGIGTKELTEAICKTENLEYIYRFASKVDGADINLLEKAMTQKKTVSRLEIQYIWHFANTVLGRSTDAIIDILLGSRHVDFITDFAQLKGAPIDKLTDEICKRGIASQIYLFALHIKEAPREKIEKALKEKSDEYWLKEFYMI